MEVSDKIGAKLALGQTLTSEQVEELASGPNLTPEQAAKMFTPRIGRLECSKQEALFLNDVSVFTVRIYLLAQQMRADTGIAELDAVTKPAKVLIDLLLLKRRRRLTLEECLLYISANKDFTNALRHVGIANYLACEEYYR